METTGAPQLNGAANPPPVFPVNCASDACVSARMRDIDRGILQIISAIRSHGRQRPRESRMVGSGRGVCRLPMSSIRSNVTLILAAAVFAASRRARVAASREETHTLHRTARARRRAAWSQGVGQQWTDLAIPPDSTATQNAEQRGGTRFVFCGRVGGVRSRGVGVG